MPNDVLVVDDDTNLLAGYRRSLRKFHKIDTAPCGQDGLTALQGHQYRVIVSDMAMPGMNGVQFLAAARQVAPDATRIMLTGNADQQTAIDAINEGSIYRFLSKPCTPELMVQAIDDGLELNRLVTAEKNLLQNTLNGSVKLLSEVLSLVDPEEFGRGMRMREMVRKLAEPLHLDHRWELELAAMMAPLGVMTLPEELRHKTSHRDQLDEVERDMVDRVPEISSQLIHHIPRLEGVADLVLLQNGNSSDNKLAPHLIRGGAVLCILNDLTALEAQGCKRNEAIAEMRTRQQRYDPQLLAEVLALVATDEEADELKTVTCLVSDLLSGDILAEDVQVINGPLLVRAGHVVSASMRESLRNAANLGKIDPQVKVLRAVPAA